jgi:hypothetical protein
MSTFLDRGALLYLGVGMIVALLLLAVDVYASRGKPRTVLGSYVLVVMAWPLTVLVLPVVIKHLLRGRHE